MIGRAWTEGDLSRSAPEATCAALARGCALGKANEASGLTGHGAVHYLPSGRPRETSTGRGARLSQLAAGVVTVHLTRTT